jgi:hypothetical protein
MNVPRFRRGRAETPSIFTRSSCAGCKSKSWESVYFVDTMYMSVYVFVVTSSITALHISHFWGASNPDI